MNGYFPVILQRELKGGWCFLFRAIPREARTVPFPLSATKCRERRARAFLTFSVCRCYGKNTTRRGRADPSPCDGTGRVPLVVKEIYPDSAGVLKRFPEFAEVFGRVGDAVDGFVLERQEVGDVLQFELFRQDSEGNGAAPLQSRRCPLPRDACSSPVCRGTGEFSERFLRCLRCEAPRKARRAEHRIVQRVHTRTQELASTYRPVEAPRCAQRTLHLR